VWEGGGRRERVRGGEGEGWVSYVERSGGSGKPREERQTYSVAACRCEDVILGVEMIESYAIDW
jgi:hypothetical protein